MDSWFDSACFERKVAYVVLNIISPMPRTPLPLEWIPGMEGPHADVPSQFLWSLH